MTFSTRFIDQLITDRTAVTLQVVETLVEGGGTFHRFGDIVKFDTGYMVGGIVDTVKVSRDLPATGIEDTFCKFQHRMPTNVGDTIYFGTWVDGEVIHIDASERVDNLADAISLARERKELAVWDCANGIDIWCHNVHTGETGDPLGYPQGANRSETNFA